ncbi:uncharacterized protein LOC143017865 isoform X3 [Oratosquilla oratoria]|uniref:uncharacterized protein LOC143017865 isoform X3 n=1 Tax=Oratosquilla oratoria TaxID=337810 RepID=UPI003F777540
MASPIPHKEYVEHWTVEQVSAWLQQVQLAECCEVFLRRGIDGHSLMQINEESLLLWPDLSVRNRRRILKLISQINDQASPAAPKQKNLPPGAPWVQDRNQCAENEDEDDDDDDGFTSDEFDEPPDTKNPINALKSSPFVPTQSFASNHRFGSSGATESVRPPPKPRVTKPKPAKSGPFVPPPNFGATESVRSPRPSGPHQLTKPKPTKSGPFVPPPNFGATESVRSPRPPVPHQLTKPKPTKSGPFVPPPNFGATESVRSPRPPVPHQLTKPKPTKSGPFVPPPNFAGNHAFGSSGATESVRPPTRPPVPHELTKPKPTVNSDAQAADGSSDDNEDETYLIPNIGSEPLSALHSIASKYGEVKLKNTKTKPLGNHNSQAGTTNNPSHSERHQHSNGLPPTRQTTLENKWRNSKEEESNDTQPVQTSADHDYEQVLNTSQTPRYPINLDSKLLKETPAPPKLPPRNPPSEATGGLRMLNSPRQTTLQGSDTASSLPSASAPFLPDPVPPPTVTVFQKGSSAQLPKNSALSMRSGFNPSPLGTDKGYTRHIPPKTLSSASAKTSAFPPPPPIQPKPSLPNPNSSVSEVKVTNLENLTVKCFVSIGEGETVFLEQIHIDLMNEPWFHLITRKKAEMCVMNSKDGTFIIRPCTHNIGPLTLCLRYQGRTYNIPIRQRTSDSCFALGKEKANELAFETVPLLVETYHKKPIKLHTGDRTLLTDTPPKVLENVYVKHLPSP